MSEKISITRRLRLEANGLGEFQTYASREYQRLLLDAADEIERLGKERDEARFAAAYQYAKHHNGDVQTLMDNFCELKSWQKIQFFVGDDDHAKMEADSNNKLFRTTDMK